MHDAYLIEAYTINDGTEEGAFYIRTDSSGLIMQPIVTKGPNIYTSIEEAQEAMNEFQKRQEGQLDLLGEWKFRIAHAKLPMEFITIRTTFTVPSTNLDWNRLMGIFEVPSKETQNSGPFRRPAR